MKILTAFLVPVFLLLCPEFDSDQPWTAESMSTHPFAWNSDVSESVQSKQCSLPQGLCLRQSCTIVYASDDKVALAGNNEDYKDEITRIQFLPAEEGKLGRVYFGFDVVNFPQGGMNEKGLFFDAVALDRVVVVPRDPAKPVIEGQLILKAMEECSSVEEVLNMFEYYDFSGRMNGLYLVGDRFGNSAIIEPQTVIRKKGIYQIATSSFFPSEMEPGNITDHRYRIAAGLFERSQELSVDLIRRILSATHWEESGGSRITTLYSYICDLKNGKIYLYNFHNFEEVVKINLKEELKKGEKVYTILSLFLYETFAEKQYREESGP